MAEDADVIVVGGGLAGLVAATEIADAGKRVIVVDQEGEQSLGGQAFWSFGGLFLVDSPEQRRLGIKDNYDLALQDWMGTAGFDRDDDHWPTPLGRSLCRIRCRRKTRLAARDGPSHLPGRRLGRARRLRCDGPRQFGAAVSCHLGHRSRHCRTLRTSRARGGNERPADIQISASRRWTVDHQRRVDGVSGSILEPTNVARGQSSSRKIVGDFTLRAQAVIVASGGIGGNHDLVRQNWPKRLGEPPKNMISGVPEHVDGRMIGITEAAGARLINRDRMWHYVEGIRNWSPIWPRHGIRILPGPSSMWFDATGKRLPAPLFPGSDTLGQLELHHEHRL